MGKNKKLPFSMKLVVLWMLYTLTYMVVISFSKKNSYYSGFSSTLSSVLGALLFLLLLIFLFLFLLRIKKTWKYFIYFLVYSSLTLFYGLIYKILHFPEVTKGVDSQFEILSIYFINPLFNLIIFFLVGFITYKNKKYFNKSLFKKRKKKRKNINE